MVDRLGWTLVHFVWEGAALAAILALALGLTRRPTARYALALGALALLAALPVATFVLLGARTAALASGAPRFSPGETILGNAVADSPLRMTPLVGLWAVGVTLLSLRLVGTLLHLERWRRRHARAADPEDQARFDALARRLGLRRRIALFLSDRIEVPSAWGVLRPVVVLPASLLTGLPPAQIEGILLHELAHIRRHDYLVNLLQGVVETALFYHPAVWWVSSIVRRERERLCDDVAVAALGDPMPYARALLQLEERRQAPRPALSAREGDLMNRIARVLAPKPAPARLSPLAPSLAALAVVALALGGALRAEAQATKAPTPPKTTAASRGSTQDELARVAAELERIQRESPPHKPTPQQVRTQKELLRLEALLMQIERDRAKADLKVARAQLSIEAARLDAAKKAGKTASGGGANGPNAEVQRARELAARAQIDAARKRLEEAQRAIERSQLNDRKGATYGAPGKTHFPVWKAKDFPQGVGVLAAPGMPDARAFAQAQKELADSRFAPSRSTTTSLPARSYNVTTTYDSKAEPYRIEGTKPYSIDVQIQPQAKGEIDAQRSWEAARLKAAEGAADAAMNARRTLLSTPAIDQTRLRADLKRAMDAAHDAMRATDQADLDRVLALQRSALGRANAESLRALAQVQGVKGGLFGNPPTKRFPGPAFGAGGFSSAPGLFGKGGFGKGQGVFGADTGGLKWGSGTSGKLPMSAPRFTGTWNLSENWNHYVTAGPGGTVNVDCEGASFKKVLRGLVAQWGGSLVIAPGDYRDVNVILNGVSYRKALEVLCEAAGATLRQKDGVYLVGPRK